MFRKTLVLAALVGLFSMSAFAAGGGTRISLVGAGNYGMNKVAGANSSETKGAPGYGGGLLIGFGMGSTTTFEIGGVYMVSRFTTTIPGFADITTELKGVYIPGTLHFMMGKSVSLGLGGYYGYSLETGAESIYGANGGLRFRMGPHMFLDTRYNMSLKEVGGSKPSEVMAMLGYTFGK